MKYRFLCLFLVFGLVFCLQVPPLFSARPLGGDTVPTPELDGAIVKAEAEQPAKPLEDHRTILERNLFGIAKDTRLVAEKKEVSPEKIPLAIEDLGIRLVGTVLAGDPRRSFAIIAREDTGKQEMCREGIRLGQVLIKKILRNKVIIDAGKGDELLSLEPGREPGGLGVASQTASLTQKEVEKALPDYMQLVRTIRIRPHLEAGKPDGILVYNIDSDGIFGRMGLQDGDVIQAVNGEPLKITMDAMAFYDSLKEGGRVRLAILRGEENQELRVQIQ
jgi:general secretion pathway protein C